MKTSILHRLAISALARRRVWMVVFSVAAILMIQVGPTSAEDDPKIPNSFMDDVPISAGPTPGEPPARTPQGNFDDAKQLLSDALWYFQANLNAPCKTPQLYHALVEMRVIAESLQSYQKRSYIDGQGQPTISAEKRAALNQDAVGPMLTQVIAWMNTLLGKPDCVDQGGSGIIFGPPPTGGGHPPPPGGGDQPPPGGDQPPPETPKPTKLCYSPADQAEIDRLTKEIAEIQAEINKFEQQPGVPEARAAAAKDKEGLAALYVKDGGGQPITDPNAYPADTGAEITHLQKDLKEQDEVLDPIEELESELKKNLKIAEDALAEVLKHGFPCPEHGYYVPGYPLKPKQQQYVTYAVDSTTHCTYTDGSFTTSVVTSFDPGGDVPGGGTDPTPRSPSPSPASPGPTAVAPPRVDRPPTKPDDTPKQATSQPDKPVTPPTTDTTPPTPDDTPSDIPDNVELKVTEDVLEGGQTGGPLEGQTIKLTVAQKSDLPVPVDPKTPATKALQDAKTARDVKFDSPASQCTTNAKGSCSVAIAPGDRAAYRLPDLQKGEHKNYRLEIARPQTSGGVAEVTPGKDKIDPKALQSIGNKVASSTFKIGNRTFMRFALETKHGVEASLAPKLKEAYGPSYEEDICKEKYPGRAADDALGMLGPHDGELPVATIRLHGPQTIRGGSR